MTPRRELQRRRLSAPGKHPKMSLPTREGPLGLISQVHWRLAGHVAAGRHRRGGRYLWGTVGTVGKWEVVVSSGRTPCVDPSVRLLTYGRLVHGDAASFP